MDVNTISLIISFVMCAIGIATFVTGMVTRAKSDGEMISNIKFCLAGIADLKTMFNVLTNERNEDSKTLSTLTQQIKNLESDMIEMKRRLETIGK